MERYFEDRYLVMTLCPDVVSGSGRWSHGPGHCANIETYCEVGGCYYEVMSDNIIIVITAECGHMRWLDPHHTAATFYK